MKKTVLFFLLLSSITFAQSNIEKDKAEIKKVLNEQSIAWSNHDIDGFMKGYWKSEDLKFYGKGGITKGWQQTLDNYKKRYPSKDHTGKLDFKLIDISPISSDSYSVMGEFHLTRKVGDANGIFMIIFKKINGEWKIIADTSC